MRAGVLITSMMPERLLPLCLIQSLRLQTALHGVTSSSQHPGDRTTFPGSRNTQHQRLQESAAHNAHCLRDTQRRCESSPSLPASCTTYHQCCSQEDAEHRSSW
ncbi:hypothetical protein GDO81_019118 [Engystomops pustulosus]|uniref:Secreted protein n=1 Tax=Engystomops pustulosus TaxID=76066 RepID=A0AAV6YH53_ENGPU|nr:hypothetical protein GDO81_019118 [Engystomops pustulosus]